MKNFCKTMAVFMALLLGIQLVSAQEKTEKSGYTFTDEIRLGTTPVKNQHRSGTCWSYSGIAFLESELLNQGKGEYDLSEAFVIRQTYLEKAIQYVRWHGNVNFGPGGAGHDVLKIIEKYGIVPEEVFSGLVIGEDLFVHGEMDEVLNSYVEAVVKNKNRKLSPVWLEGFQGLLNAYLGPFPEKFTFKGKQYTPKSFAEELGINTSKYTEIGSFLHHPFYEPFILEIPDNWRHHKIHNVKLDEMMAVIDFSLEKGHTLSWAADVSEKGFSWKKGIALIPDEVKPDLAGTEKERWEALTKEEREKMLYAFTEPVKEKVITQEVRQAAFDNYTTTDDHLMEIIGRAKDQNGTTFYIVKNSWGTDGHIYEGFFYASESFVRCKTIYLLVNNDVIPDQIRQMLKL